VQKLGRILRIEALENRTLLTATVTGTVQPSGNLSNLILTGDRGDSIVVTQAGTDTYKVQGIGTHIKNTDTGSVAVSQTFSGTTENPIEFILITLPSGNNFVRVSGISIGEQLDISTGNGNDTIQVTNVSVGGFLGNTGILHVFGGNGTNAIAISNASATGQVQLGGGSGRNVISAYQISAQQIFVETEGTDTVALNRVTARDGGDGLLQVHVGHGNGDVVTVVDSSADTADFQDDGGTNGTISAALNSFSSTSVSNFKYRHGI
jgi:hypothetical protein